MGAEWYVFEAEWNRIPNPEMGVKDNTIREVNHNFFQINLYDHSGGTTQFTSEPSKTTAFE